MKKIKQYSLIATAIGALLPLFSFNFGTMSINIGLVNLGWKAILVVALILLLSLHPIYFSNKEKFYNSLTLPLTVLNTTVIIVIFIYSMFWLKNLNDQLGPFAALANQNIHYSWGWIILGAGSIISLIITFIEFRKSTPKVEKAKEEPKTEEVVVEEVKEENN